MSVTRRSLLVGLAGGSILVPFSFFPPEIRAQDVAQKPSSVDAWLRLDSSGAVTVFCGKAELGTGIKTALAQMVAEELDVAFGSVQMIMADTELCPDQLPTFGSLSVFRAGPELRRAAAQARQVLTELGGQALAVDVAQVTTSSGRVHGPGGKSIGYGELLTGKEFERSIGSNIALKKATEFKVIGRSQPRVDIPAKVFGTHEYVQNVKVAGMLHGRVLRPALMDAALKGVDGTALQGLPGSPRLLRRGNFLGVVAEREEDAIRAAYALKVEWQGGTPLIEKAAIESNLRLGKANTVVAMNQVPQGGTAPVEAARIERRYVVPFQMHASIGPSCAVADVRADSATVWSPTQSSFLTRDAIATLLSLPQERVRLIWVEGAGCYGQNGADDCTADAAMLSQLAGRPVRVQWMRMDEHAHEPKGPAMAMNVKAGLDQDGKIASWDYDVWSPTHSSRPLAGKAGNFLVGAQLGMPSQFQVVGADYNAKPSYLIPRCKATVHWTETSALRASALRALGSVYNVFAIEATFDILASASKQDPIEFRLRHLSDARARAVLEEVRRLSAWKSRSGPSPVNNAGRGVAFVHYNNYGAYVAAVVDVRIEPETFVVHVERISIAHDCGLIVNPDGLKNQIEGNAIQATSRALLEEVDFDREGVRSLDWSSYRIIRFSQIPKRIEISLLDRPDQPAVGAGEQTTCAVFAAVANAVRDATNLNLSSAPFSPDRLKSVQKETA